MYDATHRPRELNYVYACVQDEVSELRIERDKEKRWAQQKKLQLMHEREKEKLERKLCVVRP